MTSMPRLPMMAAALLLTATPAWAATLYTLPAPTTALETNTALTVDFAVAAGAGQLDFTVAGYATLDGDNGFIDILHLSWLASRRY